MANRLLNEKSVYLQQHGHNPVAWFAWGAEAFAKARSENKPLLISIGYSTCHWCHVMEHESFEDEAVAAFLNEHFVAVKVDREEHPDVDEFYMEALQTLTQRGGWPLNMFVTPELKPFFGGTYFPQHSFLSLLKQVQQLWAQDPEKVKEQAQNLMNHIAQGNVFDLKVETSKRERLVEQKQGWQKQLIELKLREFDPVWGGFGAPPKFPRSHAVSALLRASMRSEDPGLKASGFAAVAQTLKGMAYGGMRDHLQGGFHRYSTDERWLVPHFEKMLYDQALLIRVYSEAYRVFREDFYADVVEEMVDYLESEMRLPEGGFAAAQDADSEGVEGKYYVWTQPELDEIFRAESLGVRSEFATVHSTSSEGNWEGVNVLACRPDISWERWKAPDMKRLRAKLLKVRALRIPPIRDTKMIVGWNAGMASGLLHASLNCADRPDLSAKLLASAETTMNFLKKLDEGMSEIPRVVYGHEKKGQAYLEDYAALIEAWQLMAVRTSDAGVAKYAGDLLRRAEKLFRGSEGRLKSRQASQNPELPFDKLEFHDGAMASAFSVYQGVLLRQALFESETRWLELSLKDIAPVERVLNQYPVALTELMCHLDLLDSSLWKVPAGQRDEFWQAWGRRNMLSGDLLDVSINETQFQSCDYSSCFLRGERAEELPWR